MDSVPVVINAPLLEGVLHLLDGIEQIGIEYFVSVR